MKKAIEFEINGIQCDADGCGYEDMFGTWGTTDVDVKAMSDIYLNAKCPDCGANLLTQADYDTLMTMVGLAGTINEVFGDRADDEPVVGVHLEMDGSGGVTAKGD